MSHARASVPNAQHQPATALPTPPATSSTQPTTTHSGPPMSQPNPTEHTVLSVAIERMTCVRPKRSARTPAVKDASIPVMWKSELTYEPRPAAEVDPDPAAAKHAARNAGVQAHMPRSSQACQV